MADGILGSEGPAGVQSLARWLLGRREPLGGALGGGRGGSGRWVRASCLPSEGLAGQAGGLMAVAVLPPVWGGGLGRGGDQRSGQPDPCPPWMGKGQPDEREWWSGEEPSKRALDLSRLSTDSRQDRGQPSGWTSLSLESRVLSRGPPQAHCGACPQSCGARGRCSGARPSLSQSAACAHQWDRALGRSCQSPRPQGRKSPDTSGS